MTKEEFKNQQWYKSKVVYLNNEPYYAVAVDFFDYKIKLSKTKTDDDNGFWVPWRFISVNKPEPSALDLIAAERERQIDVEGWTKEHDLEVNGNNELLFAAETYLMRPFMPEKSSKQLWPWHISTYKPSPKDRVRELVKAAALIVAELDRLNLNEKEAPNA